MGKFVNANGVTFTVSDDKDDRYTPEAGFEPAKDSKTPAKKSASSKSSK